MTLLQHMVSTDDSDQLIPLLEKYVSQGAESVNHDETGILKEESHEEDTEIIQDV